MQKKGEKLKLPKWKSIWLTFTNEFLPLKNCVS